jgi:hypothetical protein
MFLLGTSREVRRAMRHSLVATARLRSSWRVTALLAHDAFAVRLRSDLLPGHFLGSITSTSRTQIQVPIQVSAKTLPQSRGQMRGTTGSRNPRECAGDGVPAAPPLKKCHREPRGIAVQVEEVPSPGGFRTSWVFSLYEVVASPLIRGFHTERFRSMIVSSVASWGPQACDKEEAR